VQAEIPQEGEDTLRQVNYEIQVLVHSRRVREYQHDGETFIEGRTGQQYKLRFVNHSPRRVLFVASIDGLSIMDGQSATRQQGRGYVVGANETTEIPGWRLNHDQVAQFIFSALDQSYAHLMGKPENIGAIGCAVFEEKWVYRWPESLYEPWPRPRRRSPRFDSKPLIRDGRVGAMAARGAEPVFFIGALAQDVATEPDTEEVGQDVGTGFGKMADHHVVSVHFNREDHPACTMVIRYMGRENLERLGIDLKAAGKPQVATVTPFPGDITITGCPPPDGWQAS